MATKSLRTPPKDTPSPRMPKTETATSKPDIPHHAGHRDRLRKRFLKGGAEALADYELLEMILFMTIPRKDVKPVAKNLIKHFGSFPAVFHASPEELKQIEKLSENTVASIKAVQASAMLMMKHDVINKPVLNSWSRLINYCQSTMAHEKKENFRILFLNKKNALIADEIQQTGTVDHTPAYPREILKRALEHGATALILVHNHPSGDPTPSNQDIDLTRHIIEAARPLSITIHDHIIVSQNGTASMKNLGLI